MTSGKLWKWNEHGLGWGLGGESDSEEKLWVEAAVFHWRKSAFTPTPRLLAA